MSIVLVGSTSGSITLQEPAVAGTTTLNLPAVSGTILTTTSPKTGNVLQVIQTYKTDVFSTTNTSAFVDITGLSVSITPLSSSSKILVMATLTDCSTTEGLGDGMFQVLRNSTAIGNADNGGTAPLMAYVNTYLAASSTMTDSVIFNFLDSPATTSATIYKVQCRLWSNIGTTGTLFVGRRSANQSFISPSSITVMEIAG
jgi:hypothetical protein